MAWSETTHPVTGEPVLRCKEKVKAADIECHPELAPGVGWECGLPEGHENWPDIMEVSRDDGYGNVVIDTFDLIQYRPHSWSFTGEV
jgi:hypothetical protein